MTRDQHCTHPTQEFCDCDWCRFLRDDERADANERQVLMSGLRSDQRTLVRFAHPVDDDESSERFRVLELRGDRVLVEDARSDWPIPPTFVYLVADLVESNP